MRTTVTLDPDVHKLLLNLAHRTGRPFKHVLNDAVRNGIKAAVAAPRKPFEQTTFSLGRALIDLTKASSLAAELEDQQQIVMPRARR